MTRLSSLRLGGNQLTSFTLPAGMTNLTDFAIAVNQLTNLVLPSDLFNVVSLDLGENFYSNFIFPRGLTNLVSIDLGLCQLTNLTLAPDMTQLTTLFVLGNPFVTFVISEPMAATNLAPVVAALRNQGVSVFTYPLVARLVQPLTLPGAFKFGITGPPGLYSVRASTNLATWGAVGVATNPLGSVIFHDVTTNVLPQKFYRALLQGPPTNMVFVPPNTFIMGSPTNEPGHNIFEGPQATVTLTRGFWIGKYEVTQGEYLEVTGTNPSDFPGDLHRPISSVTWFDATNYCWKLTQQELAAGRISPGSHYRLPTEAEWECAARAGTTTRFSYGDDDQNYTSLTNYAWFLDFAHIDLTVHPVGQKLPNPWGIYDMHGHVWEWCQDWYGDQLGGVQTDPQGPATNAQGLKVMRGGAYDYPNNDCRSASRFFRFANQPDSDLGFRVVLATEF
jgi:formylglycine-generating enzyme required for sulfatase activity